jgi:hypothetical protein
MRIGVSARLRLASLVLLALIGTWLGHAVEYGLVAGWRGVALGMWGPAHSYMLPAALLLVVGAFVLAARLAAASTAAGRRAELLWRHLRRGVRGSTLTDVTPAHRAEPRPFVLAIGLAAAQIGLYLIQENVEAAVAAAPAPGVGAIAGAHWTAPLVQLAFAVWLSLGWLVCHRALRRRQREVGRLEAVIRAMSRRRRTPDVRPLPQPVATAAPWSSLPRASRAPPLAFTA